MIRRIFWVMQNRTFKEERQGKYVWSPQTNKSGGKNKGYELMKMIHKGDIIISCVAGNIVAISEAKTNCYEAPKPGEILNSVNDQNWKREGYRVDLNYKDLKNKYYIDEYDRKWTVKHFSEDSPFQKDGKSKTRYMNYICYEQAKYFIDKILANKNEYNEVLDFIHKLDKELQSNYKYKIDYTKDSEEVYMVADSGYKK